MALKSLHEQDVIYRDIKPENVLIDGDSYIKLADFGLSRFISNENTKFSKVGTPDYVAPEVIEQNQYTNSVDFWGVGCLLQEIINLKPLEYGTKVPQKIDIPKNNDFSNELNDLMEKLLVRNWKLRLGTQGGSDEVFKHPWFTDYDFESLINRTKICNDL